MLKFNFISCYLVSLLHLIRPFFIFIYNTFVLFQVSVCFWDHVIEFYFCRTINHETWSLKEPCDKYINISILFLMSIWKVLRPSYLMNAILYIIFKETTISLHTLLDFTSMYKYVGCENIFFLLCKKIFLYRFNAIAQAWLVHSVHTNG